MSSQPKNVQLIIQQTVPATTGLTKNVDNVLNWSCNTALGAKSLSVFLTGWKTAYQALWLACHDYSCILTGYVVKDLDDPASAAYAEYPALHGTYSATPGAPAPTINAAFFFLKSFASGRSSHGGLHMGGIPAAGIVGNEFTSAYQTILNAWFTPHLLGFADTTPLSWYPMILSRKASSLQIPPPVVNVVGAIASATRSFLDKDVGTMRRRKELTTR